MYINQKALKAVIKEHLTSSLKSKRPKPDRSAGMTKTQVREMIKSTVQENIPEMLKSIDIDRIIIEKLETIDWQQKLKETADLALKEIRGIVE